MKIPCENCITLAICKGQAKTHTYIQSMGMIMEKCSLAATYCNRYPKLIKVLIYETYYGKRMEGKHKIFEFLKGDE